MTSRGPRPDLPPELEILIRKVLDAARLEMPARAEVEADLRAHFEDGLDAGATWRELTTRFGDPVAAGRRIAQARREVRRRQMRTNGRWWMSASEWWTEVRRGARRLLRTPGFALVVVVTLALGVGANASILSVVDAVLLKPLPYADPGRLVRVYSASKDNVANYNYLRAPGVAAYRTWTDVFDDFGALYTYRQTGADLTEGGHTDRVTVVRVVPGYFETLGIPPALGRAFREDESFAPGTQPDEESRREPAARVAMLSHGLWASHFGEARDIVGHDIELDGVSYEIVGVMPRGFTDPFGAPADVWVPQDMRAGGSNSWGNYYLSGVARLKHGLSVEAAQARVDILHERMRAANPDAGENTRLRIVSLHDDLVGTTRRTMLLILAVAAALVLLTACVNLANLLFTRGLGRDRDVAVRAALGSGRARIVAGLLVETAILAVCGGVLGLALGWAGIRGLLALAPDALPVVTRPELGSGVFTVALLATVIALVVSGVTPALRLSRTAPADALRSEGRSVTGGRRRRRTRDVLAVVQVAAALVLVTAAALLGRSFAALRDVPLHLNPDGVLAFEVNLPGSRYPDGASRIAFHETFHRQLESLPEVERVGAVSWLPLNGRYHIWGVYWDPEHPTGGSDEGWHVSDVRVISGDYFASMGISIVRGPSPVDVDPAGEPVVWVSRKFVSDVFGDDRDPMGQQVYVSGTVRRVVGVVDDVPYDAQGDVSRKVYILHAQFADNRNWTLIQTVKVRGDLAAAQSDIRHVLAGLDGQLVLYHPESFADVVAAARAQDRFATALMVAFALLALMLALVGTYGVLANSVAGRTREFGIRMALGADGRSVRGLVLRYATALVVPGMALGLVGAWIGARWLRTLLFQVRSSDPVVYVSVLLVFGAVGVVAGWAPARRATRVDPARTLSVE
ncbi:MAG: ADOP family duplicated permease [Gemmatimonadetes bacterium]|nr:ADOP family duplicated permease [Gemmatimonadota bacterium]